MHTLVRNQLKNMLGAVLGRRQECARLGETYSDGQVAYADGGLVNRFNPPGSWPINPMQSPEMEMEKSK